MYTLLLIVCLVIILVLSIALAQGSSRIAVEPMTCTVFSEDDIEEDVTPIDLDLMAMAEPHFVTEVMNSREYYDELADIDWGDELFPLDELFPPNDE